MPNEFVQCKVWWAASRKRIPDFTDAERAAYRKIKRHYDELRRLAETRIYGKDGSQPVRGARISRAANLRLYALSRRTEEMPGDIAGRLLTEALTTKPSADTATGVKPLALSAKHSRFFRLAAALLNVEPSEWLKWMMNDLERDMRTGLLGNWAADLIEYDSPETAAEVQARVNAWLAKQKKGGRSK